MKWVDISTDSFNKRVREVPSEYVGWKIFPFATCRYLKWQQWFRVKKIIKLIMTSVLGVYQLTPYTMFLKRYAPFELAVTQDLTCLLVK
jgi:hypothetical protein